MSEFERCSNANLDNLCKSFNKQLALIDNNLAVLNNLLLLHPGQVHGANPLLDSLYMSLGNQLAVMINNIGVLISQNPISGSIDDPVYDEDIAALNILLDSSKQLLSSYDKRRNNNKSPIVDEPQSKLVADETLDNFLMPCQEMKREVASAIEVYMNHAFCPDINDREKPISDLIRIMLQKIRTETGDLSQTQFEDLLISRAKEILFERYIYNFLPLGEYKYSPKDGNRFCIPDRF